MNLRRIAAACATAAFALAPLAIRADDTSGYAGKGTLVVQTVLGETKLTIGGNIAFEERDPDIRIDVLSLAIPGADPTVSALVGTQLFPPGGFTIVYDRKAATYTIWSNAKRTYYTPPQKLATPAATPSPIASGGGASTNGLFAVFAFLRTLKNDRAFSVLLALTGHGTTNGHPSTGLHFEYKKTTTAGDVSDFHGELQLADDLNEIPIALAASVKSNGIPQSTLKIDATSIAEQTPSASDFAVPDGYARAAGLGDVIGKNLPH